MNDKFNWCGLNLKQTIVFDVVCLLLFGVCAVAAPNEIKTTFIVGAIVALVALTLATTAYFKYERKE